MLLDQEDCEDVGELVLLVARRKSLPCNGLGLAGQTPAS